MSILFAVKVFCDLCLYFSIAGCMGGAAGMQITLLWPALLGAFSAGLAAWLQPKRLTLLALLPLAVCLMLPHSTVDWLVLAPALLYCAVLVLRGRFAVSHGGFAGMFPRGLLVIGLATIFGLLGMALQQALIYGALYLFFGVFLLRQLRLRSSSDGISIAVNTGILLVTLLLCLGGAGILLLLLKLLQRFLVWGISESTVALEWLYEAIGSPERLTYKAKYNTAQHDYPFGLEALTDPEGGYSNWVAIAVTVVLVIAVLAALYILLRRMLRSFRHERYRTPDQAWTETAADLPRRKGLLSNRGRVRHSYRKFLQLLHSRGASLLRSDTSAQVHDHAVLLTDPEPASRLRDLYRRARYDDSAEICVADVHQARALVRQLQNTAKE